MNISSKPKASDISDATMLDAVARFLHEHGKPWATTWDLQEMFPEFPLKVVVAKCGQLIWRGLMNGCTCGCRGDFRLTHAGRLRTIR